MSPWNPDAPADSVDGVLRDEWDWERDRDVWDHPSWLKHFRGQAAKTLRGRLPTGVVTLSGESRRDATVRAIKERDDEGAPCSICGITWPGLYEIDHCVPLTKGGRHALENLTLVHPWCNGAKRNRTDLTSQEICQRVLASAVLKHAHPDLIAMYAEVAEEETGR